MCFAHIIECSFFHLLSLSFLDAKKDSGPQAQEPQQPNAAAKAEPKAEPKAELEDEASGSEMESSDSSEGESAAEVEPASPLWALNASAKVDIFSKLYEEIVANSELPKHNSEEFMHALGIVAKMKGVDIWTKDSKRGKTPDFGDKNCKWRAWQAFLAARGNASGLVAKSPKSKKSSKPSAAAKKVKAKKVGSPKIPSYLDAAFLAYEAENGKKMPKKLKSIAVFIFKKDE